MQGFRRCEESGQHEETCRLYLLGNKAERIFRGK
jgi:hypothetical protein